MKETFYWFITMYLKYIINYLLLHHHTRNQFFLYLKKDIWKAHSKYCFIKPLPLKESYIFKPGGEEPLTGIIKYINQELIDLGLSVGDEIIFEPESEYPFYINDEKLYRMLTNNIAILM